MKPNTAGASMRVSTTSPLPRPKAADLDDRAFLMAVALHNDAACDCEDAWRAEHGHWALTWDLDKQFPAFPSKVVRAKAGQLIKRGLLDGCACGCRGDFFLTDAGKEFLDPK